MAVGKEKGRREQNNPRRSKVKMMLVSMETDTIHAVIVIMVK